MGEECCRCIRRIRLMSSGIRMGYDQKKACRRCAQRPPLGRASRKLGPLGQMTESISHPYC